MRILELRFPLLLLLISRRLRRHCDATRAEPVQVCITFWCCPFSYHCASRRMYQKGVMIKSNLGVHCGSMMTDRKTQPADRVVENSVVWSIVSHADEAFSLYTGCSDIMPVRDVSTIVAYHCDMVARLITTFLVVLAPLTVLTTLCKNHLCDPDVQ
ncbi:hypothetical protein BKA63DRAFT_306895 [Paraphoma chrysanthemicola]|nr:hypothetical protein BKA63DRAFT_306895 [Paraphoma chrysanthemicola]